MCILYWVKNWRCFSVSEFRLRNARLRWQEFFLRVTLQGRKPRSMEDMDKMEIVPDSPSIGSEFIPESLQVRFQLFALLLGWSAGLAAEVPRSHLTLCAVERASRTHT